MNPMPDSILDPVEHARLILDIENVCQTANLPQVYLHKSMKEYCGPEEIEWVKNFKVHRANGEGGLLLTGAAPEQRCMAICAALVRNFIDARIVSLDKLTTDRSRGEYEVPMPTVMIIPDLYAQSFGKPLTAWQIQSAYDVLLSRLTANKPTVAYVQNFALVADAYGAVFADHLKNHYTHV